ncbi:porin [Fulvivirga sp.]|uniref:porin n=1 Tax=Fulvivirga sp. TaxID=1931237 RepID=UPI0032EB8F23
MKNRNILSIMTLFLSFSVAFAQEEVEETESSAVTVSGSVDAYFRTNLGAPNKMPGVIDGTAPGTSFANRPGFSLGMVNLILAKEGKKAGFVADLVFGPRGEDAVFGSPMNAAVNGSFGGSAQIVNQLYAYWNVSDNVTLTMGNFNTFLGYEVISPTANFNYSTSYMFSYGPFSHTGLKADFALSDDMSAMVSIMNPTDMTEFNFVSTYTLGAQFGIKGVYFNFLYGDQDGKLDEDLDTDGDTSAGSTFQGDITAGFDLSDKLFLGLNATYNSTGTGEIVNGTTIEDVDGDAAGFYGLAGYFQVATSDALSLGARIEYFQVYNGGLGVIGLDADGDGSVIDVTLSAQYKVGDLTIIPEFRLDSSSEDSFTDSDYLPTKSLSSFVLAAVYSF